MAAVTIQLSDAEDFGPMMFALNERERAWVLAVVALGGSGKEAAAAAGYGAVGTPEARDNAQRQAASRLNRSPKVQAAIIEEAENRLKSGALLATEALMSMVKDTTSKHHFKAVQMLHDRSIGPVVQRQEIVVKKTHLTDAEIDQKIQMLQASLAKAGLLPPPAREIVVDAEFEPAPSTDGLEDLFG
jgi:phage terminase small subunit